MLHAAFCIDRPDAHAPSMRAGDPAALVAAARGALDRKAIADVGNCLDQLAGLLAANRAGGYPSRVMSGVPKAPPLATKGGLAPWQLRRVCALVEGELHTIITVEMMANAARLSGAHFCRAFKSSTGRTPHAFVMLRRMLRAQALMLNTGAPLSEIADACGLADQSHLARVFRRLVGETPSAWRRHRKAGDGPTPQAIGPQAIEPQTICNPRHHWEFTT